MNWPYLAAKDGSRCSFRCRRERQAAVMILLVPKYGSCRKGNRTTKPPSPLRMCVLLKWEKHSPSSGDFGWAAGTFSISQNLATVLNKSSIVVTYESTADGIDNEHDPALPINTQPNTVFKAVGSPDLQGYQGSALVKLLLQWSRC